MANANHENNSLANQNPENELGELPFEFGMRTFGLWAWNLIEPMAPLRGMLVMEFTHLSFHLAFVIRILKFNPVCNPGDSICF